MPPKKQPWFRFYVEAVYDHKLRRLPVAQRWVWVSVLALARQSPVPGHLFLAGGDARVPLTIQDVAAAAGVSKATAVSAVKAFKEAGMLAEVESVLEVVKWHHRQFKSDDVSERTAKSRSRERGRNVPSSTDETPSGDANPRPLAPSPPHPPNPTPPAPGSNNAGARQPRKPVAKPLSADWVPNEAHRELAAELGVNVDMAADEMRDWALSKGERKVDWDAAFRNWVRRTSPTPTLRSVRPTAKPNGSDVGDAYFALADKLRAEGR